MFNNDDFSNYFFTQYQENNNSYNWDNENYNEQPETQNYNNYSSTAQQADYFNQAGQVYQSSDSEMYNAQSQGYGSSDYSNFDFDSAGSQNNISSVKDWNNSFQPVNSCMPTGTENYMPDNFGWGNQPAPAVHNNFSNFDTRCDEEPANTFGCDARNRRDAIGTDSKLESLANHASDKAVSNANGVKNYITITSKTFAKFILEQSNIEIQRIIIECINQGLPENYNAAQQAVMNYITDKISGKKIHRNGSKQYKITARKDIEAVFFEGKKDTDDEKAIKKILRSMMARFLRSQTFQDWIVTEYEAKSSGGKDFYLDHKNLEQIVGVYTDSDFKPRFN